MGSKLITITTLLLISTGLQFVICQTTSEITTGEEDEGKPITILPA